MKLKLGSVRTNFTNALQDYIIENNPKMLVGRDETIKLLDSGGSVGVNSKGLLDAFPKSKESILVRTFWRQPKCSGDSQKCYPESHMKKQIRVMCPESMPFNSDSMDFVTVPFVIHELPTPITESVIHEAMRVLKPRGILSISELNGKTIESLPMLRRCQC